MFVLQFSVGEVALGDVLANEVGERACLVARGVAGGPGEGHGVPHGVGGHLEADDAGLVAVTAGDALRQRRQPSPAFTPSTMASWVSKQPTMFWSRSERP